LRKGREVPVARGVGRPTTHLSDSITADNLEKDGLASADANQAWEEWSAQMRGEEEGVVWHFFRLDCCKAHDVSYNDSA
jgi:hypothetical protein